MPPHWTKRWQSIKTEWTPRDLTIGIGGTVLVIGGLGLLHAPGLEPLGWISVGVGAVTVLAIKWKYWTRFWGG